MQKSNMLNLEVDPKWPKDPVKIFLQVRFEDFQRGGGLYTRGKTFQNLGAAMEETLPPLEQEQKTRPGLSAENSKKNPQCDERQIILNRIL